ncbi:MAG: Carbamoyl-phosphate synthase large chain [Candidatus Carbobacillus altaicus]|uniref:Carbamoyl-phosphate synthase large chain n=1 Tax=Candidatus Carbonibacillus altaicus TaxID=2163959 RepID=A0A2R6Y323_9BACL|nr:MAG: Carbamoyl-phosphate synthase large chain [Candidatus Carbobacillus altaicus]
MVQTDVKKVMLIGSGPIVIGQGAEFDYAGNEARRALLEEGLEIVLVNSNPATMMTEPAHSVKVYLEALTEENIIRILQKERPQGLLAAFGGQTGLNLARALHERGVLETLGVRILGTQPEDIALGEDRARFRALMQDIGEPIPPSTVVGSVEEARAYLKEHPLPLVIRPAYTLGGSGGGIARDERSYLELVQKALVASPIGQCLIETSLLGQIEVEVEVIRDASGKALVVAVMENIDPVGVHTGDSIVVTPALSLRPEVEARFRQAALKIAQALSLVGGANVQFAYDKKSDTYAVIEVNPRLSRSSALASKATGYPIAYVSAKLALGARLAEIVIGKTGRRADEPPVLRDVVVKMPRFPFDAFPESDRLLGTEMRATGEVMAIGATWQEAFFKAWRSLDMKGAHEEMARLMRLSVDELARFLARSDDLRILRIWAALHQGMTIRQIAAVTDYDLFYLDALLEIVRVEQALMHKGLDKDVLLQAKQFGMDDRHIARLLKTDVETVQRARTAWGIFPTVTDGGRMADAGEKPPLLYWTYVPTAHASSEKRALPAEKRALSATNDASLTNLRPRVVVIGSGPIRIGQGIEFDYASVQAVQAARALGYEVIMLNNNPSTVSTDMTVADKLYLMPLDLEAVESVLAREKPQAVIVQMGGQTALNLASGIERLGYHLAGTELSSIEQAEDRGAFDRLLEALDLRRPRAENVYSAEEARSAARRLGYPLIVRPSFVLGGREMAIIADEKSLNAYIERYFARYPGEMLLVDSYIEGREMEVDAISDGEHVFIPGIIEHIERSGVHSGDSIAVFPAEHVSATIRRKIEEATVKLARGLHIRGLINIQFIVSDEDVYVLEANPRASRTLPMIKKLTGRPIIEWATEVMLGKRLTELGFVTGHSKESGALHSTVCLPVAADQESGTAVQVTGATVNVPGAVAVKVPVFSFAKLSAVDVTLGPVMKSTGEVLGIDETLEKAMMKALLAAGQLKNKTGAFLLTFADKDKPDALPYIRMLADLGYRLYATPGTARLIREADMMCDVVAKLSGPSPTVLDLIHEKRIDAVLNTWTVGTSPARDGFRLRREAVEHGVPTFTSLDTIGAFVRALYALTLSFKPLTASTDALF